MECGEAAWAIVESTLVTPLRNPRRDHSHDNVTTAVAHTQNDDLHFCRLPTSTKSYQLQLCHEQGSIWCVCPFA